MADRACSNQSLLSRKQRQTRKVSPNTQRNGHSTQDSAESGGCSADRGRIRGLLQPGAITQRLGLGQSAGSLGRSSHRDLRRARSKTGGGPRAAIDSNTAGLGEGSRPGRPPAGSIPKRKIPGGLGDRVTQVQSSPSSSNQTKKTNGISALVLLTNRRFSLNQYKTINAGRCK